MLVIEFVERTGANYTAMNNALGAVYQAAREYERRVLAPYEQEKCRINGDVYS